MATMKKDSMLNTHGSLAYYLARGQNQRFTGYESIGSGSKRKAPTREQVQQGDHHRKHERASGPGQQYG